MRLTHGDTSSTQHMPLQALSETNIDCMLALENRGPGDSGLNIGMGIGLEKNQTSINRETEKDGRAL
jgi:hypothetical protein